MFNSSDGFLVIFFLLCIIGFGLYLARPKPAAPVKECECDEETNLEEDVWLDAFHLAYTAMCVGGRHPAAAIQAACEADKVVELFNKRYRDYDCEDQDDLD